MTEYVYIGKFKLSGQLCSQCHGIGKYKCEMCDGQCFQPCLCQQNHFKIITCCKPKKSCPYHCDHKQRLLCGNCHGHGYISCLHK